MRRVHVKLTKTHSTLSPYNQSIGVGPSWKQPDATHIVMYKKKETGLKELDGRVACKLTADNHGRAEWWLLLDPVKP